jgi:hypothetical protein
MNDNEHVVIALYADRATAEETGKKLKAWDKANSDIKLGAIGTIYLEDGEVKTDAGRKLGRGATIGAILGVTVGVLTGPIGLVGGALVGGLGGGALGAFFKESLNLTEAEIAGLGAELQAGRAALVINCDDFEVEATEDMLRVHGGEVKSYAVPAAAVAAAAAALDDAG